MRKLGKQLIFILIVFFSLVVSAHVSLLEYKFTQAIVLNGQNVLTTIHTGKQSYVHVDKTSGNIFTQNIHIRQIITHDLILIYVSVDGVEWFNIHGGFNDRNPAD